MLPCIRTDIFFRATGCIPSSRRQSTTFIFRIVLKWETLSFIGLSGNLAGWEFQEMHMHVVLLEIRTHLSKTTDWTSSTNFSERFKLCIKLLDKHSEICSLLSSSFRLKLAKVRLGWLFSTTKLIFYKSSRSISTIKISQDSFKFSKGDTEK